MYSFAHAKYGGYLKREDIWEVQYTCRRHLFFNDNASRPRRRHLWIRVLVCPWEVVFEQGKNDLVSIDMWSHIDWHRYQMSSTWHPDSVKIQSKSDLGAPMGRFRAPGRKQTSCWQQMGGTWVRKRVPNSSFLALVFAKFWVFARIQF